MRKRYLNKCERYKLILFILSLFILLYTCDAGWSKTIKKLRVVVEPLIDETDIKDNEKEIEVEIVPQGFTDLAISDISISPLIISTGTVVDVWVGVKNKGSEPAYGVKLNLYALGKQVGKRGTVLDNMTKKRVSGRFFSYFLRELINLVKSDTIPL